MVSVVIPTFNRERTIKRAVDSVLNQTYKDIEVIVVDDCSTDNTEKIIMEYNDSRLKYYKLNKNSGACVARNKGVELAKGEYIAFQDSDDSWDENKLEIQLNNMEKNDSDVDFCMIKVVGEIENKTTIKPTSNDLKRIKKYGINKALCFQSFISTQSLIGKSECIKNIEFDIKMPRLQDYDLMIRLSSKYKVSITEKALVNLYVQNDSISKSNEKLIKAINIMIEKDYNLIYKNRKILLSSLNEILGNCYKSIDKLKAKEYYKLSLKYKFNLKVFLKLILYGV